MAYSTVEPFGEERADLRAGIIAATIVNVNRTSGPPAQPDEYMPTFGEETQGQSQEEIDMRLGLWCDLQTAFQGE